MIEGNYIAGFRSSRPGAAAVYHWTATGNDSCSCLPIPELRVRVF